jgi:ADP-heptose:LPS heptosyltransferase
VTRTLAVRLDNAGDVLLAGPAVRALAAGSKTVIFLAGPNGRAAAQMLPGVDEVLTWRCPWIDPGPGPVQPDDIMRLVATLRSRRFDRAVVFTSFHQSPLPTALVLRMAGVAWVGAVCADYPGSLLDLRHHADPLLPEPERALSLAIAAGFDLPREDDGTLAVRRPLPDVSDLVPRVPYVVLHPGTSVPARAWSAGRYAETAALLTAHDRQVVVTGAPSEVALTAGVCAGLSGPLDLGGRTDLAALASVLEGADVVVTANTGPAHLAAAVGTPVVSLFAPTVPAERWAPYRVPSALLGDQDAVCRDTRVTECPFPGHPCLNSVTAEDLLRAVEMVCGREPVQVGSSSRRNHESWAGLGARQSARDSGQR